MGIFGREEPAANQTQTRCEMCEALACAYATGTQQLLQAAMWVDRAIRFSEPAKVDDAIVKVDKLRPEVEQAWTNYLAHRAEHSESGN